MLRTLVAGTGTGTGTGTRTGSGQGVTTGEAAQGALIGHGGPGVVRAEGRFDDAVKLRLSPRVDPACLFVLGLDVRLEDGAFNTPVPVAAKLDRGEFAGAHQGVGRAGGDV